MTINILVWKTAKLGFVTTAAVIHELKFAIDGLYC